MAVQSSPIHFIKRKERPLNSAAKRHARDRLALLPENQGDFVADIDLDKVTSIAMRHFETGPTRIAQGRYILAAGTQFRDVQWIISPNIFLIKLQKFEIGPLTLEINHFTVGTNPKKQARIRLHQIGDEIHR
ncbi:MAG: hypothetical protein M0Q49_11020, partial [Porticoccaceae bacterium]|nr:hypothetical protein [Porticoccaceae bacterium]